MVPVLIARTHLLCVVHLAIVIVHFISRILIANDYYYYLLLLKNTQKTKKEKEEILSKKKERRFYLETTRRAGWSLDEISSPEVSPLPDTLLNLRGP